MFNGVFEKYVLLPSPLENPPQPPLKRGEPDPIPPLKRGVRGDSLRFASAIL
jgi:hypothetical protein